MNIKKFIDVHTLVGAASPIVMLSLNANARAVDGRGWISGGGAKMSCPTSSLVFASEICFFKFISDSLSRVPLSSLCFATSGIVTGFFGDTVSSSPKEIWLIPDTACWGQKAGVRVWSWDYIQRGTEFTYDHSMRYVHRLWRPYMMNWLNTWIT